MKQLSRRAMLAASGSVIAASASARLSQSGVVQPMRGQTPVEVEALISFGQSDVSNAYNDFGSLDVNYRAVFGPHVPVVGGTNAGPGPLPNGANGRSNTVDGIASYASTDAITIGRAAVVTLQEMRTRANPGAPLIPYLEFSSATPGSSWTDGGLGGLGPGLTFTGVIVDDVLTVSSIVPAAGGGVVAPNQHLTGTGVDSRTQIVADLTGNQGAGDYSIAKTQFVALTTFTTAHATFTGTISAAGNAAPGTLLRIVTVLSGTVTVGDTVTGGTTAASTVITADLTGSGGAGDYRTQIGAAQNVSSRTMTVYGDAWYDQALVLAGLQASPIMPTGDRVALKFTGVHYLQNTSTRYGVAADVGKALDLTDMIGLYDAMNLPGPGLIYYFSLPGTISNGTIYDPGELATVTFCRTNAPGMGGPLSGRCFLTVPVFPWPWNGLSNIHLDAYGQKRCAEWVAYVAHQVRDLGNTAWTPLWRPLTGGAMTIEGTKIRIPWARPNSSDFVGKPLVWQSDALDGIKVWPQYGFHVKRSAVEKALVSDPVIDGMDVLIDIGVTPLAGDEVSYAYYGPGGPDPGPCSGIGGNLTMNGPASLRAPGKTIDAWAHPFKETL